jgi:hypothetical protein
MGLFCSCYQADFKTLCCIRQAAHTPRKTHATLSRAAKASAFKTSDVFFYSALECYDRCFENGLTKECQTGNGHRLSEITDFAISLPM